MKVRILQVGMKQDFQKETKKIMELYHGSTCIVDHPHLIPDQRFLDFGSGFYCTSSPDQASRWARAVARRRRSDQAVVNIYALKDDLEDLRILRFDKPDAAWLEFVVGNRMGKDLARGWDLIIGPVADDTTMRILDDYMDHRYTIEQALYYLQPQKLKDQYTFHTEKSLQKLAFIRGDLL